jgi:hypothetical protein
MGTVVSKAAGPLSAVSPIMSVASGFMKGSGDQAAADYQSEKSQIAAQYAKTAAVQTDAQMRENLNLQLGNIDAVRAASGVNPTSPSDVAVRDRMSMVGDRARSIQVGNIMAQAEQDEADAQYYKQAGQFAYNMDVAGGFTNAASSIAKGFK